ncbi:MAG TPA: hypothetical protein PK227_09100 [Thermomonas sp.]|nr:hypothetical protein [Thermomonas sp.]
MTPALLHVSPNHGDAWTQIGRPPYVICEVQMDSVDRGWTSRWNIHLAGRLARGLPGMQVAGDVPDPGTTAMR